MKVDEFDDVPNIESYFALWGKHEFDIESQRNILLHFVTDRKLDAGFMKYLDYHFPENKDDGVRYRRGEKP
jgi:hypothetical protein